ncbi:MAG TPA: DUF3180 domain-containing protein [Nocardioidaceae bacterium]|nr:DUF3180 domain-containing protein [Nocardioidaceae bacterium]
MSRQFEPDDEDDDAEPLPGPDRPGHVGPTSVGALVGFALTGLVLGWLVRPLGIAMNDSAPTVGWLPVLALMFVALIVGSVAFVTHRSLHRRHERLEPHQAVNRLVLAKSCALAGAMVAGGYFGYALSWLGLVEAELARQRVTQSLVGGLAGVLIVVGSLLLERACRVRDDGDSEH